MQAQALIARLRAEVKDLAAEAWADADWLRALSEALQATAQLRPEACSQRLTLTLAAGVAQALPAGAERLLAVYVNGAGGRVAVVDGRAKELFAPGWRTAPAAAEPLEVIYTPALPRAFEVAPPVQAGARLAVLLAMTPAPLAAVTEALPVSEAFVPALGAYALSVFYAGDHEDTPNPARAELYRARWRELLAAAAGEGSA